MGDIIFRFLSAPSSRVRPRCRRDAFACACHAVIAALGCVLASPLHPPTCSLSCLPFPPPRARRFRPLLTVPPRSAPPRRSPAPSRCPPPRRVLTPHWRPSMSNLYFTFAPSTITPPRCILLHARIEPTLLRPHHPQDRCRVRASGSSSPLLRSTSVHAELEPGPLAAQTCALDSTRISRYACFLPTNLRRSICSVRRFAGSRIQPISHGASF